MHYEAKQTFKSGDYFSGKAPTLIADRIHTWAQKAIALHYTRLERLARDKHINFLGPLVSSKEK